MNRQERITAATTTPEDRRAIAEAAARLAFAIEDGEAPGAIDALTDDLFDAVIDRAYGCPVGQVATGRRCNRARNHQGGCEFDGPEDWRVTIAPPAEASSPPSPCCPCVQHGEACCHDHAHEDLEMDVADFEAANRAHEARKAALLRGEAPR